LKFYIEKVKHQHTTVNKGHRLSV